MKANTLLSYVAIMLTMVFFVNCDDNKERFDPPVDFVGKNIQALEDAGNCKQFLALMDKAEVRTSIESQMYTLFVPNDSYFDAYFEKKGISSIDDLSRQEAEELFGLHYVINGRSRDRLIYEAAWREMQDEHGEYGALFHRKKSNSEPMDYKEVARYDEKNKGETLVLKRSKTYIPLFTSEYFRDYFGDAKEDYEFMYPGSEYSGTQWHDAMVIGNEATPTSSGYIYYVDRVVEPLPTIDKYLSENEDNYGLFYDMAQRFADYGTGVIDKSDNIRKFTKRYVNLSNLPSNTGPTSGAETSMLYMFTAYVPYDAVLQEYLDNTVLKTYGSIDSVPKLFMNYLLQSHLTEILDLPSKIDDRFFNFYGDNIDIDISQDIGKNDVFMCSNGLVYPMNKVLEPFIFKSVPGPIIFDKNYSTFLHLLDQSEALSSVSQPELDVTLFAVSNDALMDYGIRASVSSGEVTIQVKSSEGWDDMITQHKKDFIKNFIYVGTVDDFASERFLPMESGNYIHINNNQIVAGGNQFADNYCEIIETLPSEINGSLHYLSRTLGEPLNAAEVMMADPDLAEFVNIMDLAGLIKWVRKPYESSEIQIPQVTFMNENGSRWTVLAPTNQAVLDGIANGIISIDDEDALEEFILYHFVREGIIFDDGGFSGLASTNRIDTIIGSDRIYEKINFTNAVHNLTVTDKQGTTTTVDNIDANTLVNYGVVHKINNLLLSE